MKNIKKIISVLLLLSTLIGCLVACGDEVPEEPVHVDYASQVKLDMSSDSLKQEVTVKSFIDGDTTHFFVPTTVSETGVLKARYLAVNTPESTGKIEEYGKTASNFTKETLKKAVSIYIESDDSKWNLDSTGDRHLVWIWYKTAENEDYRNLNIEILQNGLAIASNSGQNRYGAVCLNAIAQAKAEKLNVHSGQKDPNFFYGGATPLTLKELRANVSEYDGAKVSFEGIVTKNEGEAVFVESYDEETEMYYGMYVYYGFNLSGDGLEILSVGNRVLIVGTVQYYENGKSYQVSGLQYRAMKPGDPDNIQKLDEEKHDPAYSEITAEQFNNGTVEITVGDEVKTLSFAEASLYTTISLYGLQVKSVHTTVSDSSSNGALTLTCQVGDQVIKVRTVVLWETVNGERVKVTAEKFEGKTFDMRGAVDWFCYDGGEGEYQIKLFTLEDVMFR